MALATGNCIRARLSLARPGSLRPAQPSLAQLAHLVRPSSAQLGSARLCPARLGSTRVSSAQLGLAHVVLPLVPLANEGAETQSSPWVLSPWSIRLPWN